MSDTESLEYLQTDFDPSTMTMPRLRSVLVKHNIQYPSTAKKSQLIEIFNENVVPQAKKILSKHARAKRSSRGIMDMASSQDADQFNEELLPPPSTRRSRSPRKASARVKTEEPEDLPVFSRVSRSASRQLTQASDTDTGPDTSRSARRTRRTVTPSVKSEPDDDFFKRDDDEDESVFSNDNPFQSGSSPPPTRTPSASRRKTTGLETVKTPKAQSTRRRTDVPTRNQDEHTTFSKSFEIPVSSLGLRKTPEPSTLEPGEEFSPEEQAELELDVSQGKSSAVSTRTAPPARRGINLTTPFLVLLFTMLSAYAAWYRQEKLAVGYCGLGREAKQILPPDLKVPNWIVPFVEPQCEDCPQHAFCFEDFVVQCERDFVLEPHPLSLGGLVPLPPTCQPNREKVRRVKSVADKAVEELRERRAQFECGELVNEEGQKAETPAIEEQELKEVINKKRKKRLNKRESDDMWDDLWSSAIGDVKTREEVEVVEQETDSGAISNTYLSSTSLARISFTCAIKRNFVSGLERYRLAAGTLVGALLSVLYARSRYLSHKATSAQIPALVDLVLDRLIKQKDLGDEEIDDPWLFLPNLRDDVLRSIHSLSGREKLWQRVKAVVEQNSNVRTGQREGRNGEVGRAWEWIGPMPGDGARRRKSGRVSWGPDVKSETPEMSESKLNAYSKWEDSRPIY